MAQTFLAVLLLLSARAGIPPPELPAQFTLGDYEFIAPQGWQVQRQAKAELSETTPSPPTAGIRTAARALAPAIQSTSSETAATQLAAAG